MTPIEAIGTLLIRLWAAATVIFNLPLVFLYVSASNDSDDQIDLYITMYYPGMVLFGLILWVYAAKIAKVFSPKMHEHGIELAFNPTDLVTIGSFLIGLSYLVDPFPTALIQTFSLIYQFSQDDGHFRDFSWDITKLIEQWVIALVALGLTLRPRDIARMFMWLRSAGPRTITDAPEKDGEGK